MTFLETTYVNINIMSISFKIEQHVTIQDVLYSDSMRKQYKWHLRINTYEGMPPKSHSAQIYGPGLNITYRPISSAVFINFLIKW
jgi:hypothetical protein